MMMVDCEVCGETCDREDREGCESCGRLYGHCCNSVVPDRCMECACEVDEDEEDEEDLSDW